MDNLESVEDVSRKFYEFIQENFQDLDIDFNMKNTKVYYNVKDLMNLMISLMMHIMTMMQWILR